MHRPHQLVDLLDTFHLSRLCPFSPCLGVDDAQSLVLVQDVSFNELLTISPKTRRSNLLFKGAT
jgi:hypothetical protein